MTNAIVSFTAQQRLELETAWRTRGDFSALADSAIHNVRIHAGSSELYGRDDWLRLESARFASWGPRKLQQGAALSARDGAQAEWHAVRWRLESAQAEVPCAALSLVHDGRIVREWQYYDRLRLGYALGQAPEDCFVPKRHGIPVEYGEIRAPDSATGTAATDIAAHPLVQGWHQLWNLRRGPMPELLGPFTETVMYCERLVLGADGRSAALQWRLFGRLVADAFGVRATRQRLSLPGLSFFEMGESSVASREDYYDPGVLVEQTTTIAAGG